MTVSLKKGKFVDRDRHVQREDDVKIHREDSHLQGKEGDLNQILPYTPPWMETILLTPQF